MSIEQLERIQLDLPIKGLNDTDDQITLDKNVLVSMLNFEFTGKGIKTRDGYTEYTVSGIPATEPITGLFVYGKSDGNNYLIAASSSALSVEGAVGVFSSIKGSLSSGQPWEGVMLSDLMIMGSSNNTPQKYNATECKDLEVVAPTLSLSSAVGATGALTGAYQYKVTFVSASGAETNPSPASTTVNPSSQQVDLTSIPLGGTDVAKRNIYRTTNGGTVFYYLQTVNDNVTTTSIDNALDSALSTDLAPAINDSPPANLKFLAVFKQFLFGVNPAFNDRYYFSHQKFPEIFYTAEATGYYLVIGLNDGEAIIGGKPLGDTFYVFKEASTWPVTGDNPDDLKATGEALSHETGLYHKSIAYVDQGSGDVMVGLSKDGFYSFDGFTFKNIGVQPELQINISGFLAGLDKSKLHWAFGYNDVAKHQYRCFVTESGSGINNKELVWDYVYNRITIYDRQGNAAVLWSNNIIFGSALSDSKINIIGGLNDNGIAISVSAEFPWWEIDGEFYTSFRQLNIDTTLQGNYSATVTFYVDSSSVAYSLSLNPGTTWGSLAWNTDGGTYRVSVPLNVNNSSGVNLRGTNAKVKLTHAGLNQPVTLNGMTLLHVPSQERRVS